MFRLFFPVLYTFPPPSSSIHTQFAQLPSHSSDLFRLLFPVLYTLPSSLLIHSYPLCLTATVTLAGFIRWVAFATGETTISVRGGGIASVGMETPREVRDAIRNAVHSRILGRVPGGWVGVIGYE